MNRTAYHIFLALPATCLSLLLVASPAFSQAVVESAILGSAAAAAAPGVKGAGAATAGIFEALRKTLDSANLASPKAAPATVEASTSVTSTGVAAASAASAAKENRAFVPKDLSGLVIGKTRQELVDKYGQPALKTTETNDDEFVERYTYMQTRNDTVVVELRAGVVSKVELKPSKASRSVISLQ